MEPRARVGVSLFGPFMVRIDDKPAHLTISGHTLDVFKYLLIHAGRAVRREHLSDLFWPDATGKRRRSTLNTAIWRLRNQLCGQCGMALVTEGDAVCLEVGPDVSVDGHELAQALNAVLHPDEEAVPTSSALARLETALSTLDQPFLDGLASDWALIAREKYFEMRTRGLAILMRSCGENKRFDDAIDFGQRLLAEDPFRESTHCELMWLYVLTGRRAQAIRQFERCSDLLQRELSIEPMAELRILYDRIRTGSDETVACAAASAEPPKSNAFGTVLNTIERSRMDIYTTLCQQLR